MNCSHGNVIINGVTATYGVLFDAYTGGTIKDGFILKYVNRKKIRTIPEMKELLNEVSSIDYLET